MMEYFVIFFDSDGCMCPMTDGVDKLATFASEWEAEETAWLFPLAQTYGFEIYQRGACAFSAKVEVCDE